MIDNLSTTLLGVTIWIVSIIVLYMCVYLCVFHRVERDGDGYYGCFFVPFVLPSVFVLIFLMI